MGVRPTKWGVRNASSLPSRDVATFGFAFFAHAALIAIALVFANRPNNEAEIARRYDGATALIDIEFASDPKPEATASASPASEKPSALVAATFQGQRGVPKGDPLPDLPPIETPPLNTGPGAMPKAPDGSSQPNEYEIAPMVPMAGNGSPFGPAAWTVPGVLNGLPNPTGTPDVAPQKGPLATKAPPNAGGSVALRDGVLSRDRDLGLGTPGATAIANEVANAVRAANVPNESKAVLVATISGDGTLISISVSSFDRGDAKAWSAIALLATSALGKRKLPISGMGQKGAIIAIDVRSAMTFPSGASEKATAHAPPSIMDGPARDVMPAQGPDGDACAPERYSDVKPICGWGFNLASGDVSDIAMKKRRQVRASFRITLLDTVAALVAGPASSAAPSAKSTNTASPSSPPPANTVAPAAKH